MLVILLVVRGLNMSCFLSGLVMNRLGGLLVFMMKVLCMLNVSLLNM